MSNKRKVWLCSTKDIEKLNGEKNENFKEIFVTSNHKKEYLITDYRVPFSLYTFYWDLSCYFLKNGKYFFAPNINSQKTRLIIKTAEQRVQEIDFDTQNIKKLLEKYSGESSCVYYDKIFKYNRNKEENDLVFVTRCFPNKINIKETLTGIYLRDYWFFAYKTTVEEILKKIFGKEEEYEFHYLLHDEDVGHQSVNKIKGEENIHNPRKITPDEGGYEKELIENVNLFYHAEASPLYNRIIKNKDFFSAISISTDAADYLCKFINTCEQNIKSFKLACETDDANVNVDFSLPII